MCDVAGLCEVVECWMGGGEVWVSRCILARRAVSGCLVVSADAWVCDVVCGVVVVGVGWVL